MYLEVSNPKFYNLPHFEPLLGFKSFFFKFFSPNLVIFRTLTGSNSIVDDDIQLKPSNSFHNIVPLTFSPSQAPKMGQKCPKMGKNAQNGAKMGKNAPKLAFFGLKMAKKVYIYIYSPKKQHSNTAKSTLNQVSITFGSFFTSNVVYIFTTPIFSKIAISKQVIF